MSDLKHRSPDELKSLIDWCVKKRTAQDEEREQILKHIETLQTRFSELGQNNHNIGVKEGWARYYLAQKELKAIP